MLNRVKSLDMNQAQVESLYDTRDEYVSEQKNQMQAGEKSDGFIIGVYRSAAYAARKSNPIARAGYVDLKDKGDFYRGIFASPDSSGMTVDSTDEKSGMLQEKYSTKIFGLNSRFRVPWLAQLQPIFVNKIAMQLQIV